MTTLIVNADDFGLSEPVNQGIADAHTGGIVTSTTWLAGGDAADEAVELARTAPQLEVGLHLALTDVRPVGDPAPFRSLLSTEGRWRSGYGSVIRW
ncbi:MAG: ChbG/HpnK family deacetylase, partial [Bacteroidota bacterium]